VKLKKDGPERLRSPSSRSSHNSATRARIARLQQHNVLARACPVFSATHMPGPTHPTAMNWRKMGCQQPPNWMIAGFFRRHSQHASLSDPSVARTAAFLHLLSSVYSTLLLSTEGRGNDPSRSRVTWERTVIHARINATSLPLAPHGQFTEHNVHKLSVPHLGHKF
jgi:hypothetical protein